MEILNGIIEYIAKTNLFNFAIFLAIIVGLCIKLNVKQKMKKAQDDVCTTINASSDAKAESETKLSEIEKSIENIGEEINSIINKSEENAKLVGEKILEDAKNAVSVIEDNAQKVILNNQELLKNELVKRASLASIEVAREQIKKELECNSELHNKLIDESVEIINGVRGNE